MKIGLIGMAKSGKTTVFNALTGLWAATDQYESARMEPNVAFVRVSDSRVDRLAELYRPRKVTHALVEFVDFCGFSGRRPERKSLFSASDLALARAVHALALVARNFHETYLDSTLGPPDAASDVENVKTELALNDLVLAETRLERIDHQLKRGAKTPSLAIERSALEKVVAFLEGEARHNMPELTGEEEKSIRGMQFLSLKPMLVILNSDETTFAADPGLVDTLGRANRVVEFAGKFEMELSRLDPKDAAALMEDMGIASSARERLTLAAYGLLGYISFFTVGSDEVRAWTIRKGSTAQEAASSIHTDLSRGFIRAECFSYDDLTAHGSEKALREKGLIRLEGKNYVVNDGDILSIRSGV